MLTYTQYGQAAFLALLENNNTWKDNMKTVAQQFSNNFYGPVPDSDTMYVDSRGYRGEMWNSSQATLAAAMIFDYCYDRLSATEKDNILQYIHNGMQFQQDWVMNNDSPPNPDDAFYRFNSWHAFVDASYTIAGLAIAGEQLSNNTVLYSWNDFNSDLLVVKENLFDDDYGLFRYMWGDNGAHLDGTAYFGINFGRMYFLLQALSHYEGIDYFQLPVVQETLGKSSKWLASSMFPNRLGYYFFFNALNTSGVGTTASYYNLLVLAQKYNDGLARWIFDEAFGDPCTFPAPNKFHVEAFIPSLILYKDISAIPPVLSELATFMDKKRGLVNWRTGWETDDILFSVESNPIHHKDSIAIRKSQADKGSITLTAYGKNLIYDPNSGHHFPHYATDANNYINVQKGVELLGEAHGAGNGFYHCDGKLDDYENYNFYETVKTYNSSAFDTLYKRSKYDLEIFDGSNSPDRGFVNPVIKAERTVSYFKATQNIPPYFWVLDDIQKSNNSVQYDWHVCTFDNYTINTSSNPIKIYHGYNPATLDIFVTHPVNYTTQLSEIPYDGTYTGAEKLSVIQTAVKGNYNIILVPHDASTTTNSYQRLTMDEGEGAVVSWNCGYIDYLFNTMNDSINYSQLSSDAKTAFIRKNTSSAKYVHYFMQEGSFMELENNIIVDLNGSTGNVVCDSNIVKIEGSNISNMQIYAPYATSVLYNGEAISYCRVNDYVYVGDLTGNHTWSNTVHISGTVNLNGSGQITVQNGTEIIMDQSAKLTIYGDLDCTGSASDSIYISASIGNQGYGIVIDGKLDPPGSADFSYCNISGLSCGIEAKNVAVDITDCTIEDCGKGINLLNSNSLIENNKIIHCSSGIYAENSNPSVTGNKISDGLGYGIFLSNASGIYSENIIENCGAYNITTGGGFFATDGSTPVFDDAENYALNQIINNDGYGIRADQRSTIFAGHEETYGGNSLYGNNTYDAEALNSSAIYAMNNYWGSGRPSTTQFNTASDGEIYYDPWLEEDPTASDNIENGSGAEQITRETFNTQNTMVMEGGNWKRLFIGFYLNKEYQRIISLGKLKLQQNLKSEEISFILNMVDQCAFAVADSTIISFCNAFDLTNLDKAIVNKIKMMLSARYINAGDYSEGLNILKDIQNSNLNTKPELLALFKEFHVYLYHTNDLVAAEAGLVKMTAKFANDELTEFAKDELAQAKCNNRSTLYKKGKGNNAEDIQPNVPLSFKVAQNYPNPFNPATTIQYAIPEAGKVTVNVYDILGQKVKCLVQNFQDAGEYSISWNGGNHSGNMVSSGIYIYEVVLKSNENGKIFRDIKKMMLVR